MSDNKLTEALSNLIKKADVNGTDVVISSKDIMGVAPAGITEKSMDEHLGFIKELSSAIMPAAAKAGIDNNHYDNNDVLRVSAELNASNHIVANVDKTNQDNCSLFMELEVPDQKEIIGGIFDHVFASSSDEEEAA